MNSRLSHYSARDKTSSACKGSSLPNIADIQKATVLKASLDAHSAPKYTGDSMTPPNSPSSSHQSNTGLLPSPWIKPCSQRAESLTESETSPAHLIFTSRALPDPDPTTVSFQQSNRAANMERDSTKASDPTVLPFPSARTLPAPTGFTNYMKTMKSESQQHVPIALPPARQMVRKRREFLLVQALKDSILNFSRTNLALRASIAEEVRKGVENTLTGIEKDPVQIVMAVGPHGKGYWSKIHQDYHGRGEWKTQPLYQIYSKKDIERILFYWAIHQSNISYGEIACRLHLPVGALLSWILGFINRVEDI